MKFKLNGKQYIWRPENMHGALLIVLLLTAIVLSVGCLWIVTSLFIAYGQYAWG